MEPVEWLRDLQQKVSLKAYSDGKRLDLEKHFVGNHEKCSEENGLPYEEQFRLR